MPRDEIIYFVNRNSSIAIRNLPLNIIFHLPDAGGADAGAEAAADAKVFIDRMSRL
jgi:hypothetical protein